MYIRTLSIYLYKFIKCVLYYSFMIYINVYYNIMKIICNIIIDIYIYTYDKLFITIEEIIEEPEMNDYLLLKEEIKDIKSRNDNICSICYENNINTCCNPCGHLYCNKCIQNTNNCYICRKNIITTIKIYK